MAEFKQSISKRATTTPLPTDEDVVPMPEADRDPEALIRLMTHTIGTAVTNMFSEKIPIPITEEEFQEEIVQKFSEQPFVISIAGYGGVPETDPEKINAMVNSVKQRLRSLKGSDIVRTSYDALKYMRLAEMLATDNYPQGREIGYQRLLSFFKDVYRQELESLERQLEQLTASRESVDRKLEEEIMGKIRDLQSKERGLQKLIEVRTELLREIKEYLDRRYDALDKFLEEDTKEALRALTDVKVEGYDYDGIPEFAYQLRKDIHKAVLEFRKEMGELTRRKEEEDRVLEELLRERFRNHRLKDRYWQRVAEIRKARGLPPDPTDSLSLPYMEFFAGATTIFEEKLTPVIERYREQVSAWERETEKKRDRLKRKEVYYGALNRVSVDALYRSQEENRSLVEVLGEISRSERYTEEEKAVAGALASLLESSKEKGKVIDLNTGQEVLVPKVELASTGDSDLDDVLKDVAQASLSIEAGARINSSESDPERQFLFIARSIADDRRARILGIGGDRSELEVLEQELSLARHLRKNLDTLYGKLTSPEGMFRVVADETVDYDLSVTLGLRFFANARGLEKHRSAFAWNIMAFYNLELMLEKLMKGELTEGEVEDLLSVEEFGLKRVISAKVGREGYEDIKSALKSVAKGQYKAQTATPYYLNPDEYISAIRDFVAVRRIREMVESQGVGRYFDFTKSRNPVVRWLAGGANRFSNFVLHTTGLKPYQASARFESCVRQALYPDTSAMNYAPSHRLKACMEAFAGDLQQASLRAENMASAIFNGNPAHFPVAIVGIWLTWLSIYLEFQSRSAKRDIIELEREIDRVVREKILKADSMQEIDRNMKDYFYREMGFKAVAVPRHLAKKAEKEMKADLIGKVLSGVDRKVLEDIRELAQRAGVLDVESNPRYRKLFGKDVSKWSKEDGLLFLSLLERVKREHARLPLKVEELVRKHARVVNPEELMDRAGEAQQKVRREWDWSGVKKREVEGAGGALEKGREAVEKVIEDFRRKRQESVLAHKVVESVLPASELEKVKALEELQKKISSIEPMLEREFSARTYSVAGRESVFYLMLNEDKLPDREREAFEGIKRLLAQESLSEEERLKLQKEREAFFLRRLGLDDGDIREMLDNGTLKNGMEYQAIFSNMLKMRQYDTFFGGTPEEGLEEAVEQVEKKKKKQKRRWFGFLAP